MHRSILRALLLSLILVVVNDPSARAATFAVSGCGDHPTATLGDAWQLIDESARRAESDLAFSGSWCAGYRLAGSGWVGGSPTRPGDRLRLRLAPAAGTTLEAARLSFHRESVGSRITSGVRFALIARAAKDEVLESCVTGPGERCDSLAADRRSYALPSGATALEWVVECVATDGCGDRTTDWLVVSGWTATLRDDDAPRLTGFGGQLGTAGDAWLTGFATVTAAGSDAGGIRAVQVLVDGAVVHDSDRDATSPLCAAAPATLKPCFDTGHLARIDTTAFADGEHTVSVRIVDAAGNATTSPPRTFRTDGTAPGAPRDVDVVEGSTWREGPSWTLRYQPPVDRGSPFARLRARWCVLDAPDVCEPDQSLALGTPLPGGAREIEVAPPADGAWSVRLLLDDGLRSSDEASEAVAIRRGVSAPSVVSPPSLAGELREGERLTASTGVFDGGGSLDYAFAWSRCAGEDCVPIAGATRRTYTIGPEDVGQRLEVTVTATNRKGSARSTARSKAEIAAARRVPSPTAVVSAAPPSQQPVIDGAAAPAGGSESLAGPGAAQAPLAVTVPQRCARARVVRKRWSSRKVGRVVVTARPKRAGGLRLAVRGGLVRRVTFSGARRTGRRTAVLPAKRLGPGGTTVRVRVLPTHGRARVIRLRVRTTGCSRPR